MGVTPNFSKRDIKNYIKKNLDNYKRAIESRFMRAGEEFISLARMNGQYTDRTGNLRSSIGYILLYNGRVVSSNFEGNGEGPRNSESLAKNLANEYPTGYVLICVAGMDYAAAVESRGKDVITGTVQNVEILLKRALKRIQDK